MSQLSNFDADMPQAAKDEAQKNDPVILYQQIASFILSTIMFVRFLDGKKFMPAGMLTFVSTAFFLYMTTLRIFVSTSVGFNVVLCLAGACGIVFVGVVAKQILNKGARKEE